MSSHAADLDCAIGQSENAHQSARAVRVVNSFNRASEAIEENRHPETTPPSFCFYTGFYTGAKKWGKMSPQGSNVETDESLAK
jgi:hypothetical protein